MDKSKLHAAVDPATPLLVTGSGGFIGRNLVCTLRALGYRELLLYDVDAPEGALAEYAARAGFVFHLAGVNRPKETEEFYTGNAGLTQQLLQALAAAQSTAPVLFSSSTQAGNGTDYAKSKEEAEAAVLAHGKEHGVPVYVYRLPGVFGKWSRPNYNSVVATFCHNVARGLPIEVRDPAYMMPLCYIDDVVNSFISRMAGLEGEEDKTLQHTGEISLWLGVNPTYEVTLGWLAGTIRSFAKSRETLALPNMSDGVTKKLWATYQSFLPEDGLSYPLHPKEDERGSFTELFRTYEHGQVSVNVAKPGITKGNHWHNTKNEKYLVVSGTALIRFRKVGENEVAEYTVSAEKPEVVDIPPGLTHSITNVGEGDLVTVMWANEPYDSESPDTYYEEV